MLLREKIYQKIRDDITKGRLLPGERLLESKFAKEFNCSHTPIREALRQLESEGLILFERNKGVTIRKISIQEIDEIYCILPLLEGCAARLSTAQANRNDVVYLRGLHHKLMRATKKNDLTQWILINMEFHNFFIEHARNETLSQTLNNLKLRIYPYRHITIRIPGHLEKHGAYHKKILEGYEAKDGQRAEKYMRLHLEAVGEELMNYLKESLMVS